MTSFNVCTYNMGMDHRDYLNLGLCRGMSDAEMNQVKATYPTIQEQTTKLLLDKAHVYCLQEVQNGNRPLIQRLAQQNFEIIRFNNPNGPDFFGTALAIDRTRFSNIQNHSILEHLPSRYNPTSTFVKDVAIATAVDNQTNQIVTFVSAHIPGFNFDGSTHDIASESIEGDILSHRIAKKLSKIAKGSLQVIGADTNANPEIWGNRFNIFTKEGFQIQRTNSPTNVNPKDKTQQDREIDFIFTKLKDFSFCKRIKSIFKSVIVSNIVATTQVDETITFDIKNNASDHVPVISKITFTQNVLPSSISKLCHKIAAFFSSIGKKKVPATE